MLRRLLLVATLLAVPAAAGASRTSPLEDKGRWICVKRQVLKSVPSPTQQGQIERKVETRNDCRWEGRIPAALDPTPVFIL